MLDLGIVSLIGSAIKLSWKLYELGFSKGNASSQRYIEFGEALHRLYSNLTTLESIVKAANTSLENDRVSTFGPAIYDTATLTEVIGNCRETLQECRECLKDQSKFSQSDGFITNIVYNVNVEPQVIHLTERLAFHNNKIGLVLDPFNIHVQTQLRDLHKEQHQDVAELLQELKHLLISSRNPNVEVPSQLIPREVTVPEELSERFALELQTRAQLSSVEADNAPKKLQLSVKDGLEAFFYHFDGITKDADAMSYLRLMKSIWIMDQIRASDNWSKVQLTNPGGLYDRCVREMDRRLRAECSRFAETGFPCAGLSTVLQLPEDAFAIWPKVTHESSQSQITHLGVLLDIPILPDLKSHTLRVVKNIDGTLGVEDTTITTTELAGTATIDRVVQKLNVDPGKAYLVPIYEMPVIPGSNAPSCTIKLQSSRDGINGVAPEFKSTRDLLKLQHLITGYRCVKQRKAISVTSLTQGQDYPSCLEGNPRFRRKSSTVVEDGNLQLWQKVSYEKSSGAPSEKSNQIPSPGGASSLYPSSSSRSFTSASISSIMSSAHTQQISLGSTRKAIELTQPELPLLVLFLKHPDTGQLSFLVIQVDERTKVEPKSCDCRRPNTVCAVSVLERSGTPLLARRYYARNGLNSWNLAAIGEHWSSVDSESVQVRNMYWLRLTFNNEAERKKFNDNLADLVRIFAARMEDYRHDLNLVRGTHIVSQTV